MVAVHRDGGVVVFRVGQPGYDLYPVLDLPAGKPLYLVPRLT